MSPFKVAGLALLFICTLSHIASADVAACSQTDAVEAEGNMALLQKASTRASTMLAEQQPAAPAAETESMWHNWQQSLYQTFWPKEAEEEAEKAAAAEKAAIAEKAAVAEKAVAEKAAALVDEAILKEVQVEQPERTKVAERPLGKEDEVEEKLVHAVEERLKESGATQDELEEIIESKSGTPQAVAEKAAAREAARKAEAAEKPLAEKAADKKSEAEKASPEKATVDKEAVEKAAVGKAAAGKAAPEKGAAEKAAAEKAAAEKAAAEKASAEKAAAEKAAAEKAAEEQASAEKAAAEKAAAEKASAEKAAAEKAAAEKAASEKAAVAKVAAAKAATGKAAAKQENVEEAAVQKARPGKGAATKAATKNENDDKADLEKAVENEGAQDAAEEKVIDEKDDAIEKEVTEKEAIEHAVAGAAAAAAEAKEPKADDVEKKVIRMDIQDDKEKPAESRKDESKGEGHGEEEEKKLEAHSEPSSEDKEKSSEQQAGDEKEKHASVTGSGSMASLDDSGLQEILKLHDGIQMALFVRRAVQKAGLLISDDSRVDKFAGGYIGRQDPRPLNFADFSKQISQAAIGKQSWVSVMKAGAPLSEAEQAAFGVVANPVDGLGLTTPLNEDGYKAVAKLNSEAQMNVFIHRVVNHLGLEITDRWGIMGILPWYSGKEAVQSFAQLTSEILKASMLPGKWVKSK